MALPVDQDFSLVRGDTLTFTLTINDDAGSPIDITGRTYTAQVRSAPDSTTVKGTFTCTVPTGTDGKVTSVLSATASALLSPGIYFYDLQENASGVISTLVSGNINVVADVTR